MATLVCSEETMPAVRYRTGPCSVYSERENSCDSSCEQSKARAPRAPHRYRFAPAAVRSAAGLSRYIIRARTHARTHARMFARNNGGPLQAVCRARAAPKNPKPCTSGGVRFSGAPCNVRTRTGQSGGGGYDTCVRHRCL